MLQLPYRFRVSADAEGTEAGGLIEFMNAPEILNERQVQEVYGFTIAYLRRARREKRGPRFLKVGKLVRYRRSDIEAYLTAHAVETADKPASHAPELRP